MERQVEVEFAEVIDSIIAVKKNLDETKRISQEEKDRDNRRNNIVIYRLQESNAPPLMTEEKRTLTCASLWSGILSGLIVLLKTLEKSFV